MRFPMLAVLLFAAGAAVVMSHPPNHDLSWNLYVASRLLDGARLNVDLVELNPPLVLYVAVVMQAIARVTGVWDLVAYRVVALLIGALSVVLAGRIGARALEGMSLHARQFLLLLYIFFMIPAPGTLFGQREHLLVMLVTPWILAAAARLRSMEIPRGLEIATGVLAAIGFALKPHYLPVWLALECLLVFGRGPRSLLRPGHVAILAIFFAYGSYVLLFAREYLQIARMTAEVYGEFYPATPGIMARAPAMFLAAFALVGQLLVPASPGTLWLRRILSVAIPLLVAAVFVQNKNWSYHWYPAWFSAAMLLALLGFDGVEKLRSKQTVTATANARPQRFIAIAVGLCLAATAFLGLVSRSDWDFMRGEQYRLPQMIQLVEQRGGQGPIVALSTNMQIAFPLVNYTGIGWGLRFPTLWMIPGFYSQKGAGMQSYHSPASMSDTERWFFNAVIEDVMQNRPTLMIVDTRAPGNRLFGFDYLTYFSQDPRFRLVLGQYGYIGNVGQWRILQRAN
jgi:hypothetical protein